LLTVMKEPGLRILAIDALGRIGDRRAVPMLLAAAQGVTPPDHMRAVSGCGDQWTEDRMAQAAAVRALGMVGDESVLPTLVAALHSTFTRAEAAAALAQYRSKAIPLLAEPTDDNVRYHVKETLALIGWRPGRI
jgi:HEAT repeat protein